MMIRGSLLEEGADRCLDGEGAIVQLVVVVEEVRVGEYGCGGGGSR
jgi:hypothetical protein